MLVDACGWVSSTGVHLYCCVLPVLQPAAGTSVSSPPCCLYCCPRHNNTTPPSVYSLPLCSTRNSLLPAISRFDADLDAVARSNASSWCQPPPAHSQHGMLLDSFSLSSHSVPQTLPTLIGPTNVYAHSAARPYAKLRVNHGSLNPPTMAVYWPLAYPLSRYR